MAELALGFFAALGTSSAAAAGATSALSWGLGTTVTTAAGVTSSLGASALSGLVGAGSSALGIMQGVATAASVASTLVGGIGAFAQGQQQADIAELQGNSEYLASEQKALQIRRDLVQKVGAARVAFAGSGLDISSAGAVESDLTNQADFATSIEKNNAETSKTMAKMRAAQYRNNGVLDLVGASLKAVGQGTGYGLDIAKRG